MGGPILILTFLEELGRAVWLGATALPATLAAAVRSQTLTQLYAVLIGALPLALITGLALGAVIWMHTRAVLVRTGGTELLPTVLAVSVLLELAPIGAGLIVAARTGASLGAELGAMRQSEQIDALEMLGLSPLRELVGPRVLACVLALPLLDLCIAATAMGGGWLAEATAGQLSWTQYVEAARQQLLLRDVMLATAKTLVFGYLIGMTGCYFGLTADGGTEGVGRAATRAVVWSVLLVVLADVFLVGMIQLL